MQVVAGFRVRLLSEDQSLIVSAAEITSSSSASATSSNTASPGASGVPVPASTSTVTITPGPPGPALSTGAKAGIGVGATILALLVVVGIVVFLRRRNQTQKAQTVSSCSEDGYEKPELSGAERARAELDAPNLYEVEGRKGPLEMEGSVARAELDDNWIGWELPAQRR